MIASQNFIYAIELPINIFHCFLIQVGVTATVVSDIAVFVLKRDVKH